VRPNAKLAGVLFPLLLTLSGPTAAFATLANSFDVPIKKQVVDLGPSPEGMNRRLKLYCFFYPTFMVKMYDDENDKGADWMSILSINKGETPTCASPHAPHERVIEYPEWTGYYLGAKANLVFFEADDGTDSGMPFVVYDSKSGKKTFEDSFYMASIEWNRRNRLAALPPFDRMRLYAGRDGQITLRYMRMAKAKCDLYLAAEKGACWANTKKELGIYSTQMPACSGYKNIKDREESAITYPVEVVLFPHPVIRPLTGPIGCWPQD
jgi:hypothetical protein